VIVRDLGEAWQLVNQPDHADLSGQFARAWGGDGFDRPRPFEPVFVAALRHDDGWAVWERQPGLAPGTSRPCNFLEVQIPSHLAFYRACITAVGDQDPYAGLLVSMHGSGIYNGRYGTQPGLRLQNAGEAEKAKIEAFIAEQEAAQRERADDLGLDEAERWVNYRLLQVYDRLSLYFCMKDLEGGEADTLEPVPRGYGGEDVVTSLEPLGPWHVRMDPFPFAESPARFTLLRRVLPKREWGGGDEFRRDFFAMQPEQVQITVES
jgi:hypothetical protein